MKNMEPMTAPLMAEVCLTLCNFVGVVGKSIVNTAAMDVKVTAEVLNAYGRALNVPAGITIAPGAVPLKFLVVEF